MDETLGKYVDKMSLKTMCVHTIGSEMYYPMALLATSAAGDVSTVT